jgi:hypothetical protein
MRFAPLVAVFCLSGCVLYFGEGDDDAPGPVDPPPDAGPVGEDPMYCFAAMGCIDGVVVTTPEYYGEIYDCPDWDNGVPVKTCEHGCSPNAFFEYCEDGPCDPARADRFCYEPPEPVRCTQEGEACATEGATDGCAAYPLCGGVVPIGACTCTGGAWVCEESCNAGLCGPDAVAAAMIGTWRGTVDPPEFSDPYEVTIEFRADGSYRATCGAGCDSVFYYGYDDDGPEHKYRVVGQTTVGALAVITIKFWEGDFQEGELSGLEIVGDRMTFMFDTAWLDDCSRTFAFDLQKI